MRPYYTTLPYPKQIKVKKNPAFNTFAKRTLSGAVVAAVVVGSLLWSPYAFLGLLAVICAGGLWEFYSIAGKAGASPQKWVGIVAGLIIMLLFSAGLFIPIPYVRTFGMAVMIALLFVIFICELYRKKETPLLNIASTIMGIIYISIPLSLLADISFTDFRATNLVILGFILLVWANDVGAYLVGVAFGRHRLFERISPKKSWEGFIGGLVFAFIVGLIIARNGVTHSWEFSSMLFWGCLAAVVVVSGVFGDLVESLLKRSVMLKDSGDIIPGHGGFLDRFDAMLFAVPFVYLYFVIFGL